MNSTSDSRSSLHATSTSQPTSLNPTWESRYQELLRWRAEHGDTCVPKAEGALGRWVARQRELKRTGKLDPVREQALNSINFVWNTVTAMWEERFRKLSEWKKKHGHCAVPIAQGELGTWVSKQRQLRKRGKLSKEKVDALDSLKFTWSTAEADWEDKFKRLVEWAREHGHASVPFNEGELGWWVNTQRQCKRKGKLSPSRESRLESLGFVWNPSNSRSRTSNTTATSNAVSSAVSSADTTPTSTPEKPEKNLYLHDSSNIVLFPNDLPFQAPYFKDETELFPDNFSPVSADVLFADITQHPTNEVLIPQPSEPFSQSFWPTSILSSPLLNDSAANGFSMPQNLQAIPSVLDTQGFGVPNLLPSPADDLEQLFARDHTCFLDQTTIDSLTCEEPL